MVQPAVHHTALCPFFFDGRATYANKSIRGHAMVSVFDKYTTHGSTATGSVNQIRLPLPSSRTRPFMTHRRPQPTYT
ncbi:uncharacterized protein SETTUDRAFT_164217 [Exserohilum turcica Et28A]|uniref:Uncharacterized protein n=1 Tax=Exserohilum turcicum (strain 28A) TaxID=671987 RepID=R0IES2_EXST2|nr:uncharacterized protein SETTUDRAFT_164217 [Exserohilum turcica Et28A]EOA83795.1 hypothetical protein SETTUDRAFT_164217 [Exserohilum turcica Et28A]